MPRTRTALLLVLAAIAWSAGLPAYRDWSHRRAREAKAAVERPVQAKLDQRLAEFTLDNVPFDQAIEQLRERTGLTIRLDWAQLKGDGLDPKRPVTVRLSQVRVSKALNVVLECATSGTPGLVQLPMPKLCWAVEDGAVAVHTESHVHKTLQLEVYDLRPLIPSWDEEAWRSERLQTDLVHLFRDTVAPGSWLAHGGTYGVCEIYNGRMIVVQTPENQAFIRSVYEQVLETARHGGEPARLLKRLKGD